MAGNRRNSYEDNWNRQPEPEGYPPLFTFAVFCLVLLGAIWLFDRLVP